MNAPYDLAGASFTLLWRACDVFAHSLQIFDDVHFKNVSLLEPFQTLLRSISYRFNALVQDIGIVDTTLGVSSSKHAETAARQQMIEPSTAKFCSLNQVRVVPHSGRLLVVGKVVMANGTQQ
jgi:hypothetical protein